MIQTEHAEIRGEVIRVPKMGRQEIVSDIKSKLESGEWYPGFKLPSTRELADHYEVATGTIDTVLEILKAQGITFESVAGGRRYVPGAPPDETTGEIGQAKSNGDEQPA